MTIWYFCLLFAIGSCYGDQTEIQRDMLESIYSMDDVTEAQKEAMAEYYLKHSEEDSSEKDSNDEDTNTQQPSDDENPIKPPPKMLRPSKDDKEFNAEPTFIKADRKEEESEEDELDYSDEEIKQQQDEVEKIYNRDDITDDEKLNLAEIYLDDFRQEKLAQKTSFVPKAKDESESNSENVNSFAQETYHSENFLLDEGNEKDTSKEIEEIENLQGNLADHEDKESNEEFDDDVKISDIEDDKKFAREMKEQIINSIKNDETKSEEEKQKMLNDYFGY